MFSDAYVAIHSSTSYDILVIGLSVLLAVFIILSIVVVILVIKLVRSIRRIVAKGEQVIDSAEAATGLLRAAATPLGILRTLSSIVDAVTNSRRHKGDK